MGCHTWFYKPMNVDIEEIKERIENNFIENLDFYKRVSTGDIDENLLKAYPELTPKKGYHYYYNEEARYKKWIKKGKPVNQKYAWRALKLKERYINGMFYKDAGYHDCFRIGNYPDDELMSYDETIWFLNFHHDKITIYDNTYDQINKFWRENPNGLIEFG